MWGALAAVGRRGFDGDRGGGCADRRREGIRRLWVRVGWRDMRIYLEESGVGKTVGGEACMLGAVGRRGDGVLW